MSVQRPRRKKQNTNHQLLLCVVLFIAILVVAYIVRVMTREAPPAPPTGPSASSPSDFTTEPSSEPAPQDPTQDTTEPSAEPPTLPPTTPPTVPPTMPPTTPPTDPPAFGVDWPLTLVNPWNFIPKDYAPELKYVDDSHAVDKRCYPDLQKMMEDCRAAGNKIVVISAFRTWSYQEGLYNRKVERLKAQGYQAPEVFDIAAQSVARPGTSEHELGLALDLVDASYTNLDTAQENTATQKWLMENSWRYGFILRYPNGTTDITGVIYEPWHYRYVGKEAAAEIHSRGITLEEYLGKA